MPRNLTQLDSGQAVRGAFDDDQYAHRTIVLGNLVSEDYDSFDLSYTGDNLTSVVYKLDGDTVATLTLSYTGDKLTNVVRS